MTRNFNLFDPAGRMDFTTRRSTSRMMIINVPGGKRQDLSLARHLLYLEQRQQDADLTIRPGVKWSDGQPFTAQDVAFTFNYGKKHPVADQQGLLPPAQLESVTASGNMVVFN